MLNKLVEKELEKSNVTHESYFPTIEHALSVLREEVEEVTEECDNLTKMYDKIWKGYRNNNINDIDFKGLEMYATNIVNESVQVIAMIRKYNQSKSLYSKEIKQIKELTQDELLRVLGVEE